MEANNFEKQTNEIMLRAQGLQIVDQTSLSKANEVSLAGKGLIKTIRNFFKPLKENAHASWKGICDAESKEIAKIEPIVEKIDAECVRYRVEQDRIRREAEEKRQRAEQERLRIEQEAIRKAQEAERKALEEQRRMKEEAERKIREEKAKIARARSEASRKQHEEEMAKIRRDLGFQEQEALRKTREEQDKILAKAAAKESEIIEAAPIVPTKTITQGQALIDNWKASVFDLKTLLAAIVVGKVSSEAVIPNMPFLNKKASESKKAGVEIPGVLFSNDPYQRKTREAADPLVARIS
jgi:DNA repair exonuclease SbcCD ATPase subunit